MANIYIGSVQYAAVTAWAIGAPMDSAANGGRGSYIRATAPAVGNERVFRCTVSGTGSITGAAEPTWPLTHNGTVADNTGTWTECTGQELDQVGGIKNPHAREATAVAAGWSAAGDRYYQSNDHAETQAVAMTVTFPGTSASPNWLVSVVPACSIPPAAADIANGGTVTTTGGLAITLAGSCYMLGGTAPGATALTFSCGTSSTPVLAVM